MRTGSRSDLAHPRDGYALDDQAFGQDQVWAGGHRPADLVVGKRAAKAKVAKAPRRQRVTAPLNQPDSLPDPI